MQLSGQKLEIVSSLTSLNDSQTRKVLNYIRALSDAQPNKKQIARNEAMRQINQALNASQLTQLF